MMKRHLGENLTRISRAKSSSQLEGSEEFTPGAGILGSSNFTRPGTESSKELNTRFTDREQVIYLYKW